MLVITPIKNNIEKILIMKLVEDSVQENPVEKPIEIPVLDIAIENILNDNESESDCSSDKDCTISQDDGNEGAINIVDDIP